MFRFPASRPAVRTALVAAFLLSTIITPVSAASVVQFEGMASSPTQVTVGRAVAYPVTLRNIGGNTLNHITVTASAPDLEFLFSTPAGACVGEECTFAQLANNQATPELVFYYRVPETPGTYYFTAQARVGEGPNDNANAAHEDTFDSAPIETTVLAVSEDLVSGHSIPDERTFSTGLLSLNEVNQHGTEVTVPTNAKVTVADLTPGIPCPTGFESCFGWASSLSVADGATIPGGITVTVRWDASELPKGMTAKKLRILHTDDSGANAIEVSAPCNGTTSNAPCILIAPFKHKDKDIEATIVLPNNGLVRGW